MKFETAVKQTPDIRDAFRSGLRALRSADRQCIKAKDTHRLRGSVNVDGALQTTYPNDPRWDYAIGHQPSNMQEDVI